MSRIYYSSSVIWISQVARQAKAKSMSPELLDTTLFASCSIKIVEIGLLGVNDRKGILIRFALACIVSPWDCCLR